MPSLWICASASLACCSACSAVTVMNAFRTGFNRSIRVMNACASSTGETVFRRSIAAASTSVSCVSSVVTLPRPFSSVSKSGQVAWVYVQA